MATYVQFFNLIGQEVQINPDQVFGLSAVPAALLQGAPAGTYISDEDGQRVAVQGTVMATAAALSAGTSTAQPAVQFDGAGAILSSTADVLGVVRTGAGVYEVTVSAPVSKSPIVVALLDPAAISNPGATVSAGWSATPGVIDVATFDPGGVPTDFGCGLLGILIP